jgi:branched-chain amino acid transport system ATP-binding protein
MLDVEELAAGYNRVPVVRSINFDVKPGEVVVLLGPNGAGKSTTLKVLAGALNPMGGKVTWNGEPLTTPLHKRCATIVGYVPEGRPIFRSLSTADNLRLGRGSVDLALEMMPELKPLLSRRAGLLSGGEQQMVALGRALAAKPALLLADELSLGLAPIIVQRLLAALRQAADDGAAVILVEQHLRDALAVADRGYVMSRGEIALQGTKAEMQARIGDIETSYLSGMITQTATTA